MATFLSRRYAVPLHNQADDLRQQAVAADTPPKPFVYIDQARCELTNNSAAFRNLFILPWLLGLWLTLWWNVDDFVHSWNVTEASAIDYIQKKKRIYGDDFFETTDDELALERYNRINAQGKMTLERFIDYHYFVTADVGGTTRLRVDIGLAIVYLITIPGLLIWAIRFPRHAPLVFDRERQLVYHWAKGKVFVQRFERLRIHEQLQNLTIQLRGVRKNGELGWVKFRIQPTGNPWINGRAAYVPVLAYVLQFMEQGLAQVLPGKESWQVEKQSFFFFEQKKPADFEAQITALLTRLDNNDNDFPLNAQGLPIPPA